MLKNFLVFMILLTGPLLLKAQLISISPNEANVQQSIVTTVTGQNFYFLSATPPSLNNTYLRLNNTQIFPDFINVIDDDHFTAGWSFFQGYQTGIYELVYDQPGWTSVLSNAFTLKDSCKIKVDPVGWAICQGDSAHLTFSNANSYQWQYNGSNIPGANLSHYYVKAAGNYSVVITGSPCPAPIPPVTIVVNAPPQALITPHGIQTICTGQTVTFNANTGANLTYQWRRNGSVIPGATSSSLTTKEDGSYRFNVTNSLGCSKGSGTRHVTVSPLPVISLSNQPGTFGGKDAYVNSYIPNSNHGAVAELNAYAWTVGGVNANARGLVQFDLSSIPPGSQIYSAELSLYYNSASQNGNHLQWGDNKLLIQRVIAPWSESTVTWNNQPAATATGQILLPASTSQTQDYLKIDVASLVKTMIDTPSANHGFMLRLQAEVKFRAVLFCSSEDANQSKRPKLVIKYIAPTITPSNGTVICNGDSTVLKADSGPYTYQWKKNGNNISGATSVNYTAKTAGTYKVKLTNSNGCTILSTGKYVTVNPLPAASVTAGGSTTFCNGDSVVLTGNSGTGLTYQWKKNNTTIPGAKSKKYTAKTAGSYKLKVTNSHGCTRQSTPVTVSVPCRDGEIAGAEKGFSAEVFPNPSSGIFNFRLSSGSDELAWIRIYDITGRIVNEMQISTNEQNIQMEIEQPGIYKAVITSGSEVKTLSLVRPE